MAGFTNYAEAKVLDLLLGGVAFAPLANVYLGAFTASPGEAGGGTEVATASYGRASVANNTTNFPLSSGGSKSNGTVIEFPTAAESWGTITYIGIFDAGVGGNLLAFGPLNSGKVVNPGDTLHLAVGSLVLTLD